MARAMAQVFKMDEEAPARLVEVANLEEHDDIVSSVAASRSRDGLVLSGGYDRRYGKACVTVSVGQCWPTLGALDTRRTGD